MKQQHCLPISGPLDTFCCGCNKKYFEYKHSTVKIFATTRPVAARHWTEVSSYSSFTADKRGKYFSRNIISPLSKTFCEKPKVIWSHLSVSAYPGSCLASELDTYECGADVLRFVRVFAVVFPLVLQKRSIRRFEITEKAPTRAFSWLKVAIRHY